MKHDIFYVAGHAALFLGAFVPWIFAIDYAIRIPRWYRSVGGWGLMIACLAYTLLFVPPFLQFCGVRWAWLSANTDISWLALAAVLIMPIGFVVCLIGLEVGAWRKRSRRSPRP